MKTLIYAALVSSAAILLSGCVIPPRSGVVYNVPVYSPPPPSSGVVYNVPAGGQASGVTYNVPAGGQASGVTYNVPASSGTNYHMN